MQLRYNKMNAILLSYEVISIFKLHPVFFLEKP